MKYYKGFDADMKCRGFQFEEGETYEEPDAELCKRGFHACEDPLDVLAYYPPASSEYHEVELEGISDKRHNNNTKVCAKKVTIGAKLSIGKLVEATINYRWSNAKPVNGSVATGDYGAASATGDYDAASATGYHGTASATGYQGAASATGDYGAASATSDFGAASATGDYGAASATGYCGTASATGYYGAASATGYHGTASATGYHGTASATGDRGVASATGDFGTASATGDYGAAVSLGVGAKAKASLGGWITIAEWEAADCGYRRIDVQTAQVDGKTIKADTYYMLTNGQFMEVK